MTRSYVRKLQILASLFLVLQFSVAAGDTDGDSDETSPKPQTDKALIADQHRVPASAMNPDRLNLLYEADPSLLTSAFQIVVVSGSAQDPREKTGLTNLMAELQLRGTKTKTRTQFQSEIERLGGTLSASVDHDSIVIVGNVIKENTLAMLKLVEEAVLSPGFSAAEFKDLKTEILADISFTKNSNYRLASIAMRRQLFAGTPLEHPSYGGLKTVKAIQLGDVIANYKKVWVRGNVVFGMVSPLPESQVKSAIEHLWQALPPGPRVMPTSLPLNVPATPELTVVHKADTSTGALVLAQEGIVAQDKLRYPLGVGNFSFGGEPLVSRLFRVIRSQNGWTYSINSSYALLGGLSFQRGAYSISATPSVEFTAKTLIKTVALWKEYLQTGLKTDELQLADESLVNSYPFEFDSAGKRLIQRMNSFLYEVPILSPEDYKKTIDGIANTDIQAALKDRQRPDAWQVVLVADTKAIEKQLASEQKDTPAEKRFAIKKKLTPEQVIE